MSEFDLELVKLRKVYGGQTVAVEDFDLRVTRGEFISFVGPSGCGKTTTLRMIAGLEEITSGDLLIRGRNFTHVQAEQRPTATIFQNYALFPHMSVRENIAFGLKVRGLSSGDVTRRTSAIIDKLELGDVAGAKESALSGGQKQRVALARGLAVEPEILLLDEPLGALDANLRKSIQEELKILQREVGITFIFVTHAQSEALSMGDRVVVMNAGRVEQISAPFELYTRPRTPFVARFIGRNILIPGRISGSEGGRAVVSTRFGPLRGAPVFEGAAPGAGATVVAPSEFVELRAPGAAGFDPRASEGLSGRISALDPVGHVIFATVELDDALSVRLETHRERFEGRGLAPGSPVDLRWRPEQASVVLDAA
ncbi:ABC transporter ATP-binding protein [uncultured Albimonas sp.]|uniref:ABC transporter ATP-binding protein n=1 Tax=uncultured Albimonas sp. TaxID=1331701 RepID=UPI0030EFA491